MVRGDLCECRMRISEETNFQQFESFDSQPDAKVQCMFQKVRRIVEGERESCL